MIINHDFGVIICHSAYLLKPGATLKLTITTHWIWKFRAKGAYRIAAEIETATLT